MRPKIFFVIYLHNAILKSILDAMRLVADSQQKNYSHITVKGPYKTTQKKRLSIDNDEIAGKKLKIIGAGNFFDDKQNTVFLKCEDNEDLYNIWKSKDEKTYHKFHPHITIYDGSDRAFATGLYETISSFNINFGFTVDKLELYSSKTKGSLFNLRTDIANYTLITKIAGIEVGEKNIDNLSHTQRLAIIMKLCKMLEKVSEQKDLLIEQHSDSEKEEFELLLEL